MENKEIDYTYLDKAIKDEVLLKSKKEIKNGDISKEHQMKVLMQEEQMKALMHDVHILAENKIPLDIKGSQPNSLLFQIDDSSHLTELLEAMEKNNTFKGNLEIISNKFTDNLGLKFAKIISNNSLRSLIINNITKPFSDRVASAVGDALEKNTSLVQFKCFFDVGEISPVHLVKFLTNSKSKLEVFGNLKMTKKLFETFSQYLNKGSNLHVLDFYYEPLKEVNLLYKKEIDQNVLDNFANKIQTSSYIIEVNINPITTEFKTDINEELTKDINEINKTLKFSAGIVKERQQFSLNTEQKFIQQNKFINNILEKIDREEGKKGKNEIVSVRSYFDRVIGESLNQALYDLEVQRERFPNKKELFTAKGSIKYIAQYLLDNKE